jgi:hypothetical protein
VERDRRQQFFRVHLDELPPSMRAAISGDDHARGKAPVGKEKNGGDHFFVRLDDERAWWLNIFHASARVVCRSMLIAFVKKAHTQPELFRLNVACDGRGDIRHCHTGAGSRLP